MTVVSSIAVQTTNSNGDLIDQISSVTYQSTQPATMPSNYVQVNAVNTKINSQTTINLNIRNVNPIPSSSQLIIYIPIEFDISGVSSVKGSGGRIKNTLSYTFSQSTRLIVITSFNENYLESLASIEVDIATVVTP